MLPGSHIFSLLCGLLLRQFMAHTICKGAWKPSCNSLHPQGNTKNVGGGVCLFLIPFTTMEGSCLQLQMSHPCACLLSHLASDFVTPRTVAHQAPLSLGILQARTLAWVAMPSSRGSFQPRDGTFISYVSCTGR